MNISALEYEALACAGVTVQDGAGGFATKTAVIARFNQATQYSRAPWLNISALEYSAPACAHRR
jgi:hypothetical protein